MLAAEEVSTAMKESLPAGKREAQEEQCCGIQAKMLGEAEESHLL